MANNPFIQTIDPERIPTLVYAASEKVGALLCKALEQVGFDKLHLATNEEETMAAMDEFQPRLVIILADLHNAQGLDIAKRINKKRVPNSRLTPKVLALYKPSGDDLLRAKHEGFWNIIPVPSPPQVLANRLETVMTRID